MKPSSETRSSLFRVSQRRRSASWGLGIVICAFCTSAAFETHAKPTSSTPNTVDKDPALWTQLNQKVRRNTHLPSLAPLVERAQEAVLVVITQQNIHGPGQGLPEGHPPLPSGQPTREGHLASPQDEDSEFDPRLPGGLAHHWGGQGSGFLIHPSGLALTNYHVVQNASDLRVRVGSQQKEVPAQVLGFDAKSDVALLRLAGDLSDWPTLPLGDSDALRVGDFVVSIGAPYGLVRSVSMGILSGRGRHDVHPDGRTGLYDFLQTDAGLHAGNSGGPLLNLEGEVVGINTAVNAHAADIGFSIPINMVKRMLPAIHREGRVLRAWLGVGIQALTPELARAFGLMHARGALVHDVVDDSPAAKSGLQPGDIILQFGDREIVQAHELALWTGEARVGEEVKIKIWRGERTLSQTVQLDAHPDNPAPPELSENFPAVIDVQKGSDVGLRIVTLDRSDRNELALAPDLEGARVVDVRLGSPAFLAGMRPDDVVVEVEGDIIESAEDFASRVKQSPSGRMMRLRLWRADKFLYVALEKP